MNKKGYITLCIVGIIYIVMGATAILSPHGDTFAYTSNGLPNGTKANNVNEMNEQFADINANLVFVDAKKIEVPVQLKAMPAFNSTPITTKLKGKDVSLMAADITKLIQFTTLNLGGTIVLTDGAGKTFSFAASEFKTTGNVFVAYADADNMPLTSDIGYFCIVIQEGSNSGVYENIVHIALG